MAFCRRYVCNGRIHTIHDLHHLHSSKWVTIFIARKIDGFTILLFSIRFQIPKVFIIRGPYMCFFICILLKSCIQYRYHWRWFWHCGDILRSSKLCVLTKTIQHACVLYNTLLCLCVCVFFKWTIIYNWIQSQWCRSSQLYNTRIIAWIRWACDFFL